MDITEKWLPSHLKNYHYLLKIEVNHARNKGIQP
jgi:hypothetical protein